jgi:hypothetical protein
LSEQNEAAQPTKFGRESVEQSQGFEKMRMAFEDAPPAEESFGPKSALMEDITDEQRPWGPKDAAEHLAKKRLEGRAQEQGVFPEALPITEPVIERRYSHQGGAQAGEPMPDNQTVPLDRAASDLAGIRETEDAAKITALEHELIQQQLHADAADAQPQSTEPQPVEPQPQPEQPIDPNAELLEELQRSPKLMAALEQQQHQIAAQVEQQDGVARYSQSVSRTDRRHRSQSDPRDHQHRRPKQS